jgi:hypothetical protein
VRNGRHIKILFLVKYKTHALKADGVTIVDRPGETAWWRRDHVDCQDSFERRFPSAEKVRVVACLLSKICQTRRRG